MKITKKGQTVKINGVSYTIGEKVVANENSWYNGLRGELLEICGGKHKYTDNDTTELICSFELPEDEAELLSLTKRFKVATGDNLINAAIDLVIMSEFMVNITRTCSVCNEEITGPVQTDNLGRYMECECGYKFDVC